MSSYPIPPHRWYDPFVERFLRIAASGWVPARWFNPNLPNPGECAAKTGLLNIEIVSHCWNYAHFLIYQLSSLALFPPTQAQVTMTVFYSTEDPKTCQLLAYFETLKIPNVTWNWRALPKQALFRRAIGRNLAALDTQADWVWFTDCDLMFREHCLDHLAMALQGRQDFLVFPKIERCTLLLAEQDPMFYMNWDNLRVMDIDTRQFEENKRSRATGPLQITHGDVARRSGYCASLNYYQKPSAKWCKAHEDRAFRWLLGTQGVPIDVPGVYRIRHVAKGRYTGQAWNTRLRSAIRKFMMPLQKR
jgi:hypothetical protein